MNIIIIGCGRVGRTLAQRLYNEKHNVTVIDTSAEKVKTITERCDIMGVVGNGATYTTQREAGIQNADLLIAVTNSDELNVLCCVVAKKEGKCKTIARVKNPDYSHDSLYLKEQLGLSMVINPEYAAAEEIARVIRFPRALAIEPFAKGKVELIKFRLRKDSPLIGMTVKDMASKYHPNLLVCTIERGEDAYIANGDFRFEERDVISIVSAPKNAREFFVKIKHNENPVKKALVVGGGVITHYLCGLLERSGIQLTIVEKDLKRCEELSGLWPKCNVIHGDGSDKELLMEEGVSTVGAFVALANIDEENILLSMYAKSVGANKLITKINRIDYDHVLDELNLDTTICPRNLTADIIVRYVRAMQNTVGSNVETMYNIIQNKVEASEFLVKENSPIIGIPLYELKLKPDVLVASITRKGEVIIPRGQDTIEAGDAVVIVSKQLGLKEITQVLR